MKHPTQVDLAEFMKRQKWWTPTQLAEAINGPGCSPQQISAMRRKLDALASAGKVFAAVGDEYRLI